MMNFLSITLRLLFYRITGFGRYLRWLDRYCMRRDEIEKNMCLGNYINYRKFESRTYDNQKIHLRTQQSSIKISSDMPSYEERQQNQCLIQISLINLSKNYGCKDLNKYYWTLLIHEHQYIAAYSESTFLRWTTEKHWNL